MVKKKLALLPITLLTLLAVSCNNEVPSNNKPTEPETEEPVETPEDPDTPETPEDPDTPDTPEVPDNPDTPDTPENPDTPDTPEVPDNPDNPDTPDTPDTPEEPEEEPVETTDKFSPLTGAKWIKVSKDSQLQTNTTILLAGGELYAPKALDKGELVTKEAKFGRVDTDRELLQLKLKKYSGGLYRIYNQNGQYLAYDGYNLTFDKGSTYWRLRKEGSQFTFTTYEEDLCLIFDNEHQSFALSNMTSPFDIYYGVNEKFIYPQELEITGHNEVEVGGANTLDLSFYPADTTEKEVTWYVSDESLASISQDGVVSGKELGEVTVTAVSVYDQSVVNQFTLTVVPAKIRVTGLKISYEELVLYEDGDKQLVQATVLPENATNQKVNWISDDPNIATVDEKGNVVPVKEGKTKVYAITDDGGYTRSCSVEVRKPRGQNNEWQLVSDAGILPDVAEVVIASNSFGVVAGKFSLTYLTKNSDSSFSNDKTYIDELSDSALHLFLSKDSEGYYYFANESGNYLGATKAGALSFTNGETRWNITFNSGNAIIESANENYGSLQYYNANRSSKFTTYTSEQKPVQIYCNNTFEAIYPESVEIIGKDEVSINNNEQYSLGYTPSNTNMKISTWSVSNTSVASISNKGVLTAIKEGRTQITVESVAADGIKIYSVKEIEVKPIAVTGISLNFTSKEIAVGKSFAIAPVISPSNATHQEVNYSSSDTSVAKVSSDGYVTGLKEGTAQIKAKTVDGGFEAFVEVTVVATKAAEWTIMIYMCGADLESDSYLATSDITEILKVKNQPDDVNIIIETGGARKWSSKYGIDAGYLQRYHVENCSLVLDESLTRANMGSSSTFQSFMEWGMRSYPAEKTGVIMWNHGGAMQGVCYDENYYSDSLSDKEVIDGVKKAFNATGRSEKLEWIGYDACLMAVQDIAQLNSKYFNYMVSSEESESGYGWDYDNWVDDLYAGKTTETILKAICDTFIAENGSNSDQTLSVVNLAKMDTYFNAYEAMSSALYSKINYNNRGSFNSLVKSAQGYTYSSSTYGIFDARDFLSKLRNNSTFNPGNDLVDAAIDAFDEMLTHDKHGSRAGNSHGLCLFWAASSGCSKGSVYTTDDTNFTNWRKIVTDFGY